MAALVTHKGGCHCGRVAFAVEAPAALEATLCNCSICTLTSYLHVIVPRQRFRLLTSWDEIATYTFNTGVAQHYFCRTCGIKSFYVPRSNPDGISVNARCLVPATITGITITSFDGQQWEANAAALAHLSLEPDQRTR